jgi:(p)ppGpp synthase/HD superfamily hydrolase
MKIDLNGQMMDRYAKGLKFAHTGDMYYELGVGQFEVDDFIKHVQKGLIQEEKERVSEEKERLHYENFVDIAQQVGKSVLLIEGEVQTNMKIVYATCCNPIPGDEVFGYVSVGNGLRIHRLNCKNASDLLAHHAERVRRVEWGRGQDSTFLANLKVIGTDRIGMFNDISTVISKNLKMNIRSIIVSAEDGIFEGTIVLDVSDLEHLKRLMQRLHSVEGVHDVYRFEG